LIASTKFWVASNHNAIRLLIPVHRDLNDLSLQQKVKVAMISIT
jgi:hypothetical protein